MKKHTIRVYSTLACAALLAGCQATPATVPMVTKGAVFALQPVSAVDENVLVQGRVDFPVQRRLLATTEEIAPAATVTLLDSTNTPVAAGLTDPNGAFTIYKSTQPFAPATGAYYLLEVSKRVSGESNPQQSLLTMRTLMRFEGNAWTSISGSNVVVSAHTTALTMFVNTSTLTHDQVIAAAANGYVGIGDMPARNVITAASMMSNILWANIDPGQQLETMVKRPYCGDVEINSQKDLEALRYVPSIDGNLTINVPAHCDFKLELPFLTKVSGNVVIASLGNQTDLRGLGSLNEVCGNLQIFAPSLTSVNGLEGLAKVKGDVLIQPETDSYALALTNLDGLRYIDEICGQLQIGYAPNLTALPTFEYLQSVGGLEIEQTGLLDMDGLEALTDAGCEIRLLENSALTNVDGLANVVGTLDVLNIRNAPALTSITGLSGIDSTAVLHLEGLPAELTSLSALDGLAVTDEYEVKDVEGITALPAVVLTVLNRVLIQSNDQLMSLASIGAIRVVNRFEVADNLALTALPNPIELGEVGSSKQTRLFITGNCSLGHDNAASFIAASSSVPNYKSDRSAITLNERNEDCSLP